MMASESPSISYLDETDRKDLSYDADHDKNAVLDHQAALSMALGHLGVHSILIFSAGRGVDAASQGILSFSGVWHPSPPILQLPSKEVPGGDFSAFWNRACLLSLQLEAGVLATSFCPARTISC